MNGAVRAEVGLIRPAIWLGSASEGDRLELNLPEMGVEGLFQSDVGRTGTGLGREAGAAAGDRGLPLQPGRGVQFARRRGTGAHRSDGESSGNWLWAWANTESNIPAHLLVASLSLRAYGEQHGIPQLTSPQLPLGQINSHSLALLASGICKANAYYRCPYEGGALFVLIMDENFPKCPDPPLQRIATVFPQAIAALDITDSPWLATSTTTAWAMLRATTRSW